MKNSPTLLPQEIVEEELLPRLPVKSVLRFRCVSKSWRSLIDSDRFMENQYRNSLMNTSLAHHRVIFNWRFASMKQCSLQSMLDRRRIRPFPSDEETDNKPVTGDATVVGCCNGLFCLVNSFGRYFLWNPATKVFFKLPKIPLTDLPYVRPKRGFGRDEATGAYKVFALSSDPFANNMRVARVYSSETNSWSTVAHGSLAVRDEVGFYACGYLHWVTKSGGGKIESFDLKSKAFGEIDMPLEGGGDEVRLGEVRGCLSMLSLLDVWVMKEHGVKESWQKLITIPSRDYGRRRCLVPSTGEVLLVSGRNFFSVRGTGLLKPKKATSVKGLFRGWHGGWYSYIESFGSDTYHTYLYVESLASPLPS